MRVITKFAMMGLFCAGSMLADMDSAEAGRRHRRGGRHHGGGGSCCATQQYAPQACGHANYNQGYNQGYSQGGCQACNVPQGGQYGQPYQGNMQNGQYQGNMQNGQSNPDNAQRSPNDAPSGSPPSPPAPNSGN